jgi:hypothetical protein
MLWLFCCCDTIVTSIMYAHDISPVCASSLTKGGVGKEEGGRGGWRDGPGMEGGRRDRVT